jgi:hypothetical protein
MITPAAQDEYHPSMHYGYSKDGNMEHSRIILSAPLKGHPGT